MASKATKQRPQVQIRITIGGQVVETTINGPLVAMPSKKEGR